MFPHIIADFLTSSLRKENDTWIQELCKSANIDVPKAADFVPSVLQLISDIKENSITKKRVQSYNDTTFDIDADDIIMQAIAKHCTGDSYEMLIESANIKQVVVGTCNRRGAGDFIFDILNGGNENLLKHIISTPASLNIIDIAMAKEHMCRPGIGRIFLLTGPRQQNVRMYLQYFHVSLDIMVEARDKAGKSLNIDIFFLLNAAIERRI
jgi:hypothetical protein